MRSKSTAPRFPGLMAGLLILSACVSPSTPPASESSVPTTDTFLLDHVHLVTMNDEDVIEDGAVWVRDGVIAWVGASGEAPEEPAATVVDGDGAWVIPGLIDMHVHIRHTDELDLYLLNGVTTAVNLSGRPDHLQWRDEVVAGSLRGPTIYTAGPTIDGDPPRNPRFVPASDAERAEAIVAEQHEAGYDFVKIYDLIDQEAYDAAAAAARARQLPVVGHIPKAFGLEGILDSHDLVAHAEEFYYTFFDYQDDRDRLAEAAELVADSGMAVCPNTGFIHSIIEQAEDIDAVLARPQVRYLSPTSLRSWLPEGNRYLGRPAEWLERNKVMYPFLLELTRAFHDAGVPLVTGTDASIAGAVPGFSLHKEIAELVKIGLAPGEALRAATANPGEWIAEHLHDPAPPGILAPGRRADLLLLDANPLESLEALRGARAVVTRGRWIEQRDLAATADERATEYASQIEPYERFKEIVAVGDWQQAESLVTEGSSELLGESAVNNLGYYYLYRSQQVETAINLFALNSRVFPESSNVWDSLGEGYMESGDHETAIRHYRRSLELNPDNSNAVTMLERMGAATSPD